MTDDRALIDDILTGDKKSFRRFIEKYQRLVSHIVFRTVNDREDSEDICQEVFLKIYQNLASFNYRSKLSTWVAAIAYNTAVSYLQKKKMPLYEDLSDNFGLLEIAAPDKERPDRLVESKETAQYLQDEMSKLPARYRVIVTLFHHESMSYTEIAAALKMPEGTVKNYLFRARKLLKNRLEARFCMEDICPTDT
jgi:RNA polymerase sigma factor (sigma-70 family)